MARWSLEKMKEAFGMMDQDNDGLVTAKDLTALYTFLGQCSPP